jgi:hypothetical protein
LEIIQPYTESFKGIDERQSLGVNAAGLEVIAKRRRLWRGRKRDSVTCDAETIALPLSVT